MELKISVFLFFSSFLAATIKNDTIFEDEIATDISRYLELSGFHRNLRTKFILDPIIKTKMKDFKYCTILLVEYFPSGVYVDKYEVDNLVKLGGSTHFHFTSLVETEKPSYNSQPSVVLVYHNFIAYGKTKINFSATIPVHFRYHLISNNSTYTKVHIPSPLIYLTCNSEKMNFQDLFHHRRYTRHISKEFSFHSKIVSKHKTPTILHIDFPVGRLSDERFVTFITLAVSLIGAIVTMLHIHHYSSRFKLSVFRSSSELERMKKKDKKI